MLLKYFLFLFLIASNESKFCRNITDFSQCKVYYSRSGSIYKDFFELNGERQNRSLLDFHFSVMSPSDAHILLAPSSNVQRDDPVYEIVIGAGGNTFCDVRRSQKSEVKATVRIKGLLSPLDAHSFWIHISEDGVIEVGKEGEELGFLTWTDPDPLPLKVFSFSTWPGVEAKWFFDCPRNNNATTNSKKIEKPLTYLEKLRQDLLYYYDPYVRPVQNSSTITEVELHLSTTAVTLNEYKSILEFRGTITMSWRDEKLKWNSSSYGEINNLHIFRKEIWIPNLYLFNAVVSDNDILEDTMLTVNSSGFVSWTSNANMNSWCNSNDLGKWPRDEHECDIVLGFIKDFQNLQLIFDASHSKFSCPYPYTSIWQILEVETYSNKGWKNSSFRNFNNFDPPGLTFHLKLQRTSTSLIVILFTPFIVVATCGLLTFYASPFGYLKISLGCLQLLISSIVLISLGTIVPTHSQTVPKLVLLYSFSLVASMFCVAIEVVVINLSRNEQKCILPHILSQILLSRFLEIILCLPNLKTSERYGNLNEFVLKINKSQHTMWTLLGVVIDKLAFFLYLVVIVYALCITY